MRPFRAAAVAFTTAALALTTAVAPASAATAGHHIARAGQTQKWKDKLGCKYMATIQGVGENSVTAYIQTDTCHGRTPMHGWAECGSGSIARGVNRTSSQGKPSKASCGGGVFFLYKWGVQSYQYAQKPNHHFYRLWVTHVFGCNGGC